MDAISWDGIDTTTSWKVDTKRPIMELVPDWLHEEAKEAAVGERGRGGGCSRAESADTFRGGGY
jgi:hypothetical protein